MMGRQASGQGRLFYAFNLEDHVPADHLLRGIDQCLDLSELHQHLTEYYSHTGRPSINPGLMMRMLIIGYRAYSGLSQSDRDGVAAPRHWRIAAYLTSDVVTLKPEETPPHGARARGINNQATVNQAATASCLASLATFSSSADFSFTASNARISNVEVGLPSRLR